MTTRAAGIRAAGVRASQACISTPAKRTAPAAWADESPPPKTVQRTKPAPVSKLPCAQDDTIPWATRKKLDALLATLDSQPHVGRAAKFGLATALRHVAEADGGRLARAVSEFGAPTFYGQDESADASDHSNTYHSLLRIIIGQQLAGAAVRAIWARFVSTLGGDLRTITPALVLQQDVEQLRASAGLSNGKARAIVDLSHHYVQGALRCYTGHPTPKPSMLTPQPRGQIRSSPRGVCASDPR
jgi:hypothetical protein